MKLRVLVNLVYRKMQSLWSKYVSSRMYVKPDGVHDAGSSFLGYVDVLEVFVPVLVSGDWNNIYLSSNLIDELREWLCDVSEAWGAEKLQFRVAESVIQNGWDDVTGIKGRVVKLEAWGAKYEAYRIKDQISDKLLRLAEITDEKSSERLIEQVKELMLERSKKVGNVKNVRHID